MPFTIITVKILSLGTDGSMQTAGPEHLLVEQPDQDLHCLLLHIDLLDALLYSQLQIRRGIEDNSKIFFLLKENICCDPSLELSR